METDALEAQYRDYIACLNARDWDRLGRFVADDAVHNGRRLGIAGYREMLEADCRAIPDLRFEIALMVVQPPRIAARLWFNVTPAGSFLDLPVNGRRVQFAENVIYAFADGRIREVWSVIDQPAIAAQLGGADRSD